VLAGSIGWPAPPHAGRHRASRNPGPGRGRGRGSSTRDAQPRCFLFSQSHPAAPTIVTLLPSASQRDPAGRRTRARPPTTPEPAPGLAAWLPAACAGPRAAACRSATTPPSRRRGGSHRPEHLGGQGCRPRSNHRQHFLSFSSHGPITPGARAPRATKILYRNVPSHLLSALHQSAVGHGTARGGGAPTHGAAARSIAPKP
jgi:hypothetical protein